MGYKWFWSRFDGRINRAKYLLATLAILCLMVFVLLSLAVLGGILGIGDGRFAINLIGISASIELYDDPPPKAWWFPEIVTIPSTLVFSWAYAAVSIKRLHDRNKSGWWMLPFVGFAGLYGQFGDRLSGTYAAAFVGLVVGILFLWGFVEMVFVKGTGGPNRFGPDPLAPRPDTTPRWDQHSALLPN
jgi:uncharacterized membrane protein YhaH (DUF805 family)